MRENTKKPYRNESHESKINIKLRISVHKRCRQSDLFYLVVFSVLCIYVVIFFFQTSFFLFNLISSDVTNHWQSMVGLLTFLYNIGKSERQLNIKYLIFM